MVYTKSVRNQLGLSLNSFADLIGCTSSTLSMVESGKRSLSAACLLSVAAIEEELAHINPALPPTAPLSEKELTFLTKHIKKRQFLLSEHRQMLEQVETRYGQAMLLLRLTQSFNQAPFLPDTGVADLQMKILQRKAQKKAAALSYEWTVLQVTIAGLEAEIARAGEIKNL